MGTEPVPAPLADSSTCLDLARAAAGGEPGLVVLVIDRDGLLIAAADGPASVELDQVRSTWQRLVAVAATAGPGAAVVVSLGAGFEPAAAAALLPDLQQDFATIDWEVVDWLVETGGRTASVATGER
ncbi:MAG TPA: hypothetical protein VGB03_02280 [Acidimicrobiales bacterium]|jgi:hypothetical protein